MTKTATPKSRARRQAEVDAAHLCLLLQAAVDAGLIKSVKVDVDACKKTLDEGLEHDVVPRHDLIEPAKLLTQLTPDLYGNINKPKINLNTITVTMRLKRRPKQSLDNLQPIFRVQTSSERDGLTDIGICRQGIAVRVESSWYVVDTPTLFCAVAEAYGLHVEHNEPPGGMQGPRGMFGGGL